VSQDMDLLKYAKSSVEKIAKGFTKHDDDFTPTLLVRQAKGGVVIFGLAADMNDQRAKDECAKFMVAACACLRSTEVCLVSSAWTVKYERQDGQPIEDWREIEKRDDFTMPRDHRDSVEVVNIMHASSGGDTMASADINRSWGYDPPTLGEWEDVGGEGVKLGGRFGDAIHAGMELGQKMFTDNRTPPEIIAYMDQQIENGEIEELIASFMRSMTMAAEMRKGQGS
jgi:hypothetical protein